MPTAYLVSPPQHGARKSEMESNKDKLLAPADCSFALALPAGSRYGADGA
jgi:hypothetical protein